MTYTHVITDAQTGETQVIPFTAEETAAQIKLEAENSVRISDPLQKLKSFLETNPDVAELLNKGD